MKDYREYYINNLVNKGFTEDFASFVYDMEYNNPYNEQE